MEDTNGKKKGIKKTTSRKLYSASFIVAVLAIISVSAIAVARNNELNTYKQQVENQYNRAFHETVDYVRQIDSLLAKSRLISSPEQMASISSEIFHESFAAKSNMGQLPIIDANIDNTSKFLVQAGDYAFAVSQKMAAEGKVTEEDTKQLSSLSDYCSKLYASLRDIQDKIYSGEMRFGSLAKEGHNTGEGDEVTFVSSIENVEKEFADYPTLMYDGPFSEHIDRLEAKNAPKDQDIGQDAARQIAVDFLGPEKSASMVYNGEENGNIPCYTYAAYPEEGSEERVCYVNVTRSGGHVLMYLDNRAVQEESLDFDAATVKAGEFLQARGIYNMKQSYYDKTAGVATINFAYVQDDIVMYPDLIKVRVALDNGEILGIESKGYIMAHQERRQLPEIRFTEQEARQKVNKGLNITKSGLAVIATDSYREVLCYEFHGNFEEKNFIVYINANTGQGERILLLIESEDGVLTM